MREFTDIMPAKLKNTLVEKVIKLSKHDGLVQMIALKGHHDGHDSLESPSCFQNMLSKHDGLSHT